MMKDTFSTLQRLPIRITGNDYRVIALPFAVRDQPKVVSIIERVRNLPDDEAEQVLTSVAENFRARHRNLEMYFREHFALAAQAVGYSDGLSEAKQLLVGAYCTMEYSFEAAALFNPSMVLHPNQQDLPEGHVRFVMSLRATGEGHVSSLVFQTGTITDDHRVSFDPPKPWSTRTRLAPDQVYVKGLFSRKLEEMGALTGSARRIIGHLGEEFSLDDIERCMHRYRNSDGVISPRYRHACETLLWLARCNYQLQLEPDSDISDLIIFPRTAHEAAGIEDLRLVRFVDDNGKATYYGTFTAFNGQQILPELMETRDFRRIQIHTLNGKCAQNKGLALFPRRIDGHFATCSRIDGQNLYIMLSDYVHFWESAELLAEPIFPWELRIIGNSGSPVETPEGWLLLMHGVGPMRQYCIGAMLLDLDDPLRVIGRLQQPILCPTEEERGGYVPNVVYSCGSMIHGDRLYIPYAMSDTITSLVTVRLEELLDRLKGK